MPTGYTYKVEKGQSFKEYMLSCAKQFGALMHMKDNGSEEIKKREVGNYYI